MLIKRNIPNLITLGNLFCGCLAIIKIFENDLAWASYLVGIALVLDFFDGFFARLLKVSSPIGKDLDSLADMVTFGLVPGLMMYKLLALAGTTNALSEIFANRSAETISDIGRIATDFLHAAFDPEAESENAVSRYLKYFGLILPVFACIRLARFNNDTRQSDSFIGLPTPSVAMVICSLPLILKWNLELFEKAPFSYCTNPYFLCGLSLVFSLLMVAEIPLFALKFKTMGWSSNQLRYLFLLVATLLLALLKFMAVPLIIILYILVSIVNNIFSKNKV